MSVPAFDAAYDRLVDEVEALARKNPHSYASSAKAKRLGAIQRLVYETIPADPANPAFHLGGTLGPQHTHWFRAKFFQQYRLFFRFSEQHRVIVYGWVNDESQKRAYGSSEDAYKVFAARLKRGHPPSDWDDLMSQAHPLSARR